jgi:O-antigen/teichoic acid export membrane protein
MTRALMAAMTPQRLRQLWYIPLLCVAMGLMLVRSLVMARLLDVPGFAQFSAGLLVSSSFSMLGCLGLQSLLQRDMPVHIVRRRERAGAVLLMQCLLIALACALVCMSLAVIGVETAGLSSGQLAIAILHGLSQQVFVVATVESRSRSQPLMFARQMLLRAVVAFLFSCAAALIWRDAGAVLLAEAVVSLLLTQHVLSGVWRRMHSQARLTCHLALRRMGKVHWSAASALAAVAILSFLLLNVDRWVAARMLPPEGFAHYAFAWTVLMVAQSVQVVINASVFPILARRFGSAGAAASFRIAAGASGGALVAAALFAYPAYWIFTTAVDRWFPAYSEARPIIGIFMLIAVLRLSDFWTSQLVIIGLEKRLLMINVSVAVLVLCGWMAMLVGGPDAKIGLIDIAWLGLLLTGFCYVAAFMAAWTARKHSV